MIHRAMNNNKRWPIPVNNFSRDSIHCAIEAGQLKKRFRRQRDEMEERGRGDGLFMGECLSSDIKSY